MVGTLLVARAVRRRELAGAADGALAVFNRNATSHRGAWIVIVSGFAESLLYLLSLGMGMGKLVGQVPLPGGQLVDYPVFVAPAMLATAAMSAAVAESTFNFFFKLKYMKLYDAVLATPVTPIAIAVGETAWVLFRGAIYTAGFMVLMVAFGLTPSWWTLAAFPAALLIGLAFAGLGMATTSFMRSWQDFDYTTVVVFLMFLFSGTFAPVEAYPEWLRPVILATPLYHGVALIRGLTTGALSWTLLANAGYLILVGTAGFAVAARRVGRLLIR